MNGTTFLGFVGDLSSFLTIFTALASGYAAVALWKQRRLHRKAAAVYPELERFNEDFHYFETTVSENPWAWSVNLLPNQASAKPEIETFYKEGGKAMPKFRELSVPGIHRLPEDLKSFLNDIRAGRHAFDAEGATEIDLFFAGPVGAALYLGGALDNWKVVKIYQRNSTTKKYEFWGTLRK
jgi:hypothetical protein